MTWRLVWVVGVLTLVACGGDEDEDTLPTVDCKADAGIPTYSEVSALTVCTTCHSSKVTGTARKEAPTDINFDTYDAAKMHAQKAASEVNGGSMSPADSKLTLTASQKQDLYLWSLCGTPQ